VEQTIKDQMEFVKWLKDNGIYNEMASSHKMQFGHDVYFTLKREMSK